MGAIKMPLPVKLIMPMFTGEPGLLAAAEEALTTRFGPTDYRSQDLAFAHTDYYADEFGSGLLRRFLAFERLVDPGELATIKRLTNDLEATWCEGVRRRINLDPGYISAGKLVLATTKDHGHRVYLGQGIYAEVTLTYRNGAFRPYPWTYPDYASAEYIAILHEVRALYMAQTRDLRRRAAPRNSP